MQGADNNQEIYETHEKGTEKDEYTEGGGYWRCALIIKFRDEFSIRNEMNIKG